MNSRKRDAIAGVIAIAILLPLMIAANSHAAPAPAATSAPIAGDSAALKSREQRWFLQYADRALYPAAEVARYSDEALKLTTDANEWNAMSDQDKFSTRHALWTQWVNDYAHFHPKYKGGGTFTLEIDDLNGTELASYY